MRVFHGSATCGVLIYLGRPKFVTLELPWKGNQRRVSCIPEGRYWVGRVNSPRFGWTYEVKDVPGRDAILFLSGF